MTNILTKFIDWLLPDRTTRIAIIDRLIARNEYLEKRLDEQDAKFEKKFEMLEKRIAENSCFRTDCPNRLSIGKLLQSTRNNTTTDSSSSQDA